MTDSKGLEKAPVVQAGAFLCLAILAAQLSGCASGAHERTVVKSLQESRQQNVVLQEWDLSCGAAALATVLRYQHNDPVPEKTIAESMLRRTDPLTVRVKGGFSLFDLKRFTESRGFTGTGYFGLDLAALEKLGPAITPVNLGDFNHFVVFRGIVDNKVLIADPAFGNRSIDRDAFERGWLGNIGFVIGDPTGRQTPNRMSVQPADFIFAPAETVRHAIR